MVVVPYLSNFLAVPSGPGATPYGSGAGSMDCPRVQQLFIVFKNINIKVIKNMEIIWHIAYQLSFKKLLKRRKQI